MMQAACPVVTVAAWLVVIEEPIPVRKHRRKNLQSLMRMKGVLHPDIEMNPIGNKPTPLGTNPMMTEDPVTNMVNGRHLHPLVIVAVESEDTVMTGNQIVGVMNGADLHLLTTQTKEVGMIIAREAQEHLQDLIGTVADGNGKTHLAASTVMIVLAPKDIIQHDLLCWLLHLLMHDWFLLG